MKPTWFSMIGVAVISFFMGGYWAAQQQRTAQVIPNPGLTMWQARAQKCEANFSTFTILYEPGTSLSIPVLHGLVDIQAGAATGLQTPAHPAWVIPAKIEPRVIANQPGLVYAYIDRQTGQIDGPYPPAAVAAGDKFTDAGWTPR